MCPSARTIFNAAETPEELCRVGGLRITQEALDFCEFAPGSRLVDIGCGKGATVRYLRAAGFDARGIDCDTAIVEQAGPYCRLGDASALPFEAESLDGLLFECSFSQMASRNSVLAEARRVLKSGGALVISDLYFRSEAQGGFLPGRDEWQKTISEADFSVLLFEDKSDGLAEFAARLLLQHGRDGIKELCGCDIDELKAGRCGYFLMIARKEENHRGLLSYGQLGVSRREKHEISPLQQWVGEKTGLLSSLNPHTLEQYQFLRLREQLCYARSHSPYYSRRLHGLDIERITGRDSLPLLPFTPARTLREEPQKLLCISGGEAQRITTLNTSGSSGDTKRVWFSPSDLDRTVDFFAQGMATMVGPGKTALVLLSGSTPDSLGDLLSRALAGIGVKAIIHGPVREMTAAVQAAKKADCIAGLPVQLNRLCLCARDLHPKTVLLTADYVPQGIIDNIRNLWGSEVFTHYGMTESGFGLAVQCYAHEALHLRDAEFIIEIVDPASGQLLPDGQWGELVLTSLCNEAMPLIRYRTGDITRRIVEPCSCGGTLARLDKVRGRISGITQKYPMYALDEALFLLPGLLDYRANILSTPNLGTPNLGTPNLGTPNLGDNGLDLVLDGLSAYNEEDLRRVLGTQGLEPPVLKFRMETLPVFGGPAKRNVNVNDK